MASSQIHIVHIVESFGGGCLTVLSALTHELHNDFRHTVIYSIRAETPTNIKELFGDKVDLIHLEMRFFKNISLLFSSISYIKNFLIHQSSPIIVHCHSSIAGVIGRLAAWQRENSLNESEAVELLNLETNRRRTVQAEEGFYIRALGFMGTDFIYGEARKEDVAKSITGSFVFPMGYVAIQDENGVKIREFSYEQQGKYAVDISIENNRTILDCVAKDEAQGYTEALPELITKNASISVIDYDAGTGVGELLTLNDCSHLDGLAGGKRGRYC